MRLIDANAYAAELWKMRQNYQMLDDTHTADKIMHGIFRAEQTLKEQPTIDAVPVSYIYKRAMELKNDDMMYAYTVLNSLIANYRADVE